MPLTRIYLAIACMMVTACSGADGQLSRYEMTDGSVRQWKLPGRLKEISGLALSPDGRLFAVADENAVVYEIDYARGALIKSFAMGDPVIPGDFEGIAWLYGMLYLTTSDGVLYASREGGDGEQVAATRVDTGIGADCEVEGLASRAVGETLVFVCKDLRKGGTLSELHIFEWSVADRAITGRVRIPVKRVKQALGTKHFNPSGIVIDTENGHFLIVAARQRALVELGADGRLVAARGFRQPNRHRQAEGIELTSNGKLLIADEGGDKKARLAVYEPRPGGDAR
jgi:uncharacterized protein YjiK